MLTCRSVNEVICHGIPDMRPLEDGDILNSEFLGYVSLVLKFQCTMKQRDCILYIHVHVASWQFFAPFLVIVRTTQIKRIAVVFWRFLSIFQRFLKIFWKYVIMVKDSRRFWYLVRIWKTHYLCPVCSGMWVLWVNIFILSETQFLI